MRAIQAIFLSIAICSVTLFSGWQSSRIPEKPIDDAAITKSLKAKLGYGAWADYLREFSERSAP
jgi:hypothetical protein